MTSNAGFTLLIGLLFATVAGCTEETDTRTQTPPVQSQALPGNGQAFYGVNVEVSYAGPRDLLGEEAMIYVFLRPPGKRMPLAVQQFSARELPRTVSFAGERDDAVELVARLSPSGRVDRSPEDVEVVQQLSGLRHPPQTLPLILGAPGTSGSGAAVAPAAPAERAAPAGAKEIAMRVSIAEGHSFPEEAVVFVIARRPGQVMPSAVRRLTVADLPAEVALSDADSMTFSNRLSDAPVLDLFARVSVSGTTARSSEDWVSQIVRFDASHPDTMILSIERP